MKQYQNNLSKKWETSDTTGLNFPRPTAFSLGPWPSAHLLFYGPRHRLLFRGPHVSKLLFHGP